MPQALAYERRHIIFNVLRRKALSGCASGMAGVVGTGGMGDLTTGYWLPAR